MGLTNFFSNRLRIRTKLLLAFGSILLLSVLLVIIAIGSIRSMLHHKNIKEDINRLEVQLAKVDLSARNFIHYGFKNIDFLRTGDSEILDEFRNAYDESERILAKLQKESAFSSNVSSVTFNEVRQDLSSYTHTFGNLVIVLKERGFQDYGIEGDLRASIHGVENSDFDFDKSKMLMLRRHEKDFFLRKKMKYLAKFNAALDDFYHSVEEQRYEDGQSGSSSKDKILLSIQDYKEKFNYIVMLEKNIGLTDTQGLKGEMAKTLSTLQPRIKKLGDEIKQTSERQIDRLILTLFSIFILQLSIGFILVLVYANLLTKAIKELKEAMVSLANGLFPDRLIVKSKDEIGETKKALNELISRIAAAVDFSTALGNGELDKSYQSGYHNDVLAKSIINMQKKLVSAESQQAQINWANHNMAQFTDILKDDAESLSVLGDKVTKNLVRCIGANQGALYMQEEGSTKLKRLSTYAYGRKKFELHEVEVGQGLIGQCMVEKETIHMTKLPEGYTKITSGLGEATPNCLLITPLKHQNETVGVLELASFNSLEKHQIQFVEKVSENIANLLISKQVNERTKALLDEARQKAEQLRAQEEELRQNSEELQATQEEVERQKMELEAKITVLEGKLNDKKRQPAPSPN